MKAICIFSIFLLEIILIAYPRYLWLTDNKLGQNIKYKIQENKKGISIVEDNNQRSNKLNRRNLMGNLVVHPSISDLELAKLVF